MASIINAATSGGLVTSADTSGVLQLQTASTTAVTVDASQNVGIGTSSPNSRLGILVSGMTNQLVIGANASNALYGGISFSGSNADTTRIGFTGGGSTDLNLYVDVPSGGTHQFRNATTTMVTVNSVGGLKTKNTIGVGDATPSTSGAGITFPATQSASSDANTLDDYEEGTWTPTDNSGAGLTFTNNGSQYTKIGRAVTINCEFTWPSTANTNTVAISMPFPPNASVRAGMSAFSNVAGEVNIYSDGGANFILYNDTGTQITNATMSTKYLIASFTYFA